MNYVYCVSHMDKKRYFQSRTENLLKYLEEILARMEDDSVVISVVTLPPDLKYNDIPK